MDVALMNKPTKQTKVAIITILSISMNRMNLNRGYFAAVVTPDLHSGASGSAHKGSGSQQGRSSNGYKDKSSSPDDAARSPTEAA